MRGAGEVVTIRVATGTTHTENHAFSTNRFLAIHVILVIFRTPCFT